MTRGVKGQHLVLDRLEKQTVSAFTARFAGGILTADNGLLLEVESQFARTEFSVPNAGDLNGNQNPALCSPAHAVPESRPQPGELVIAAGRSSSNNSTAWKAG